MSLKIESVSFGLIVINEREYTSDLIIYPDGHIEDNWRRKRGHSLSLDDIEGLLKTKPEVIVIGMGANGLMKPEPGFLRILEEKGISIIAKPNRKAIEAFNDMISKMKVGACFHLTC